MTIDKIFGDFPISIATLIASEQLNVNHVETYMFFGELSLHSKENHDLDFSNFLRKKFSEYKGTGSISDEELLN